MLDILKPHIKVEEVSESIAKFIVEPLERGFGHTFGNSMRRILHSSLPGVAIEAIKVDGKVHEFSTLPGVKEDMIEVILNLKEVVVKSESFDDLSGTLNVKGPGEIKAGDIKILGDAEIVNPEKYIATLNKKGKMNIELRIGYGRGYVASERNKQSQDSIGTIPIDSLYSPIKRVTFKVENTRVGQRTNYDRLILEVETNGSITPKEAVCMAAKIINEHANLFLEQEEDKLGDIFVVDQKEGKEILNTPIEDLELSVRSYNCLKREGVDTLDQLIERTEGELLKLRNFGQKSIEEIKEKLAQLELSLKSKQLSGSA
ncbi:MAG: DNA-directed RNA polymerase subunit alpha [Actinomycetia bacterium]|nr:DNA-directed RNA polymerase subunit alpha [Actinomycetes bacterium]